MADPAPITRYVTGRITNLAVTRDGNVIKATWKNPAYMFDETRSDRATYLDMDINFDVPNPAKGEVWDPGSGAYPGPPEKDMYYTGYDYYWLKGSGVTESLEKNFNRNRYYPLTSVKVPRVCVGVHGGNGCDSTGGRGPKVWANYYFKTPKAPTVKLEFDPGSGSAAAKMRVTIEADEGKDNYERYDTGYDVILKRKDGTSVVLTRETFFTDVKLEREYDVSSYINNLHEGEYVTVSVETWSRGIAGDSKYVEKERTVAIPVAATLGKPAVDKKAPTGRIKAPVKPGKFTESVQLYRRHGDSQSASWTAVSGAVDNGNAVALYDSYGSAAPVDGEYIWYRVRSTRDNYEVWSEPVRADCLFTAKTPLKCSASIGIVKLEPAKSGNAIEVTVGFTDSTDNDETELTWSDDPYAWNSVEGPSVTTLSGDGTAATGKYKRQQSIIVNQNLTAGVTYYFRARRHRELGGEEGYSGYSATATCATESALDDQCGFVSFEPASDGTTCQVVVGIDEDNDNTGTKLSWSSYVNAWTSNEEPSEMTATWPVDNPRKSTDWGKTHTVNIRGLEPGTTYYMKAKRYLEAQSGTTEGQWCEAGSFTTPNRSADPDVRCGIVSIDGGEDGTSAKVVVGWSGNRSGCELTWSADHEAWESSEQPQSLEFEWQDGESQSPDWAATATAYVHGLEQGTTYYVRARSYYESDTRVYSDYTEFVSVTPYGTPKSVALTAPSAVARGQAIEVWWTVEDELPQTEWHIHEDGKPFVSIADGEGSLCTARIQPERYGDADSISFYVEAGCGGGLMASNVVSVGIADAPSCEVCVPSTLAAKPATFEVVTDNPAASLVCTCRAEGITVEWPDGPRDQMEGDVMWTSAVQASWTEATWADTDLRAAIVQEVADAQALVNSLDPADDGYADAVTALERAQASLDAHPADGTAYRAVVEVPPSAAFADGGSYRLQVHATEPVANLSSADAEAVFTVAWAHQAPAPSDAITITPNSEDLVVEIAFAAPQGAASADVYDLYRKTPTGYVLVGTGLAMDTTVSDPYAPYGKDSELNYRICTRTSDGDIEFAEFPYEMDGKVLRFDWDGGHVELPYNLGLSESYSKSFESRSHVDGSVNGYWDRAVEMTGSYSSDVIRFASLEQLNAVRALGEHPGAVFCRTADGMAFQCNADVREVGSSYETKAKETARIEVKAVRLTDDFTVHSGRGGGE